MVGANASGRIPLRIATCPGACVSVGERPSRTTSDDPRARVSPLAQAEATASAASRSATAKERCGGRRHVIGAGTSRPSRSGPPCHPAPPGAHCRSRCRGGSRRREPGSPVLRPRGLERERLRRTHDGGATSASSRVSESPPAPGASALSNAFALRISTRTSRPTSTAPSSSRGTSAVSTWPSASRRTRRASHPRLRDALDRGFDRCSVRVGFHQPHVVGTDERLGLRAVREMLRVRGKQVVADLEVVAHARDRGERSPTRRTRRRTPLRARGRSRRASRSARSCRRASR